jgi:hypothetical protein
MARFVRSPDVVARRIAGEVVLVPIATRSEDASTRTANFYVLNETAETLWRRLEHPAGLDELAQQLAVDYEIEPERARGDVERFLSDLANCGAIVMVESA